jgi:hypothetical protein
MDIDHEEKLLLMEVQTLAAETVIRWEPFLSDKNEDNKDRRLMAFALLAACRDLMQFLPEDGNWLETFGQYLEATIEAQESRYEDARFAEDRRERLISLANLSILRKLRRRVTDPLRRQSLISEIYTEPLYPSKISS